MTLDNGVVIDGEAKNQDQRPPVDVKLQPSETPPKADGGQDDKKTGMKARQLVWRFPSRLLGKVQADGDGGRSSPTERAEGGFDPYRLCMGSQEPTGCY